MKTRTELKLDCAANLIEAYEGLIKERKCHGATRSDENIEYFIRKIKEYEKKMAYWTNEENRQA